MESWYHSLSQRPVSAVLIRAINKSRQDYAKDMAASIAFFTFFSLFPLLIGLIVVASFFIDTNALNQYVDQILTDTLPGSASFVKENIDAVIRLRGAAGAVSIIGLLWSARKMTGAMSRGINRALDQSRSHPAVLSPLRYFLMTLSIPVLLLLMIGVLTTLEFLAKLELGSVSRLINEASPLAPSWRSGVIYLFVFGVFVLIYKLVPYGEVTWREIVPGAVFSTILYELGKKAFLLYLDNVAQFEAVYGSLSSIIVLLIWLYYTARVLLFGAELIAVRRQSDRPVNDTGSM